MNYQTGICHAVLGADNTLPPCLIRGTGRPVVNVVSHRYHSQFCFLVFFFPYIYMYLSSYYFLNLLGHKPNDLVVLVCKAMAIYVFTTIIFYFDSCHMFAVG